MTERDVKGKNDNDAALELSLDDFWDNLENAEESPAVEDNVNPYQVKVSITRAVVEGEKCANVYVNGYTGEDFSSGDLGDAHKVEKVLIARVTKKKLETWPINLRPGKSDYLKPKYVNIKKITIVRSGRSYWSIPQDVDDFDQLLQRLPTGFSKRAVFGLGLKWEYRHILESIASIPSVKELLIPDDDVMRLDGAAYSLGTKRFDALRKAIDTIGRKHQDEALADKRLFAYNQLLSSIDAARYPPRTKEIKPGALYELVRLGVRQRRTAADRRAALNVVRADSKELAAANPVELMRLKTSIELVTLDALIAKFRTMMSKTLTESKWHKFFELNPFVLSLAFAYPVFMIRSHAFVGGTTLRGVGEKIADFLVKNRYTGNLAIIEIKRPDTILLSKNVYRTDLYGPDKHLAGAISQVLDQKYHLQTSFALKAYDSGLRDVHPFSTQCIVIIGTTPKTDVEKKSFELFRNASKDVVVITFDEMLEKLSEIRRVMMESENAGESEASTVEDRKDSN
jgi:Domain of unknown function (DUF4263)